MAGGSVLMAVIKGELGRRATTVVNSKSNYTPMKNARIRLPFEIAPAG